MGDQLTRDQIIVRDAIISATFPDRREKMEHEYGKEELYFLHLLQNILSNLVERGCEHLLVTVLQDVRSLGIAGHRSIQGISTDIENQPLTPSQIQDRMRNASSQFSLFYQYLEKLLKENPQTHTMGELLTVIQNKINSAA